MRAANIARLTLYLALLGALPLSIAGCSAGGDKNGSGTTTSRGGMGSLNLAGTGNAATSAGSGGGLVIGIGGTDGSGSASGPCEGGGWRCKVPDCTGQTPTSIRASVMQIARASESAKR